MRRFLVPSIITALVLVACGVAIGDVGETNGTIRSFFRKLTRAAGAAPETSDVLTRQADGTVRWGPPGGDNALVSSGSAIVSPAPIDLGGFALYGDIKNVVGDNNAGYEIPAAASGTLYYDTAGAGTMRYVLPPATEGLHYYFERHSASDNYLQVQARAGESITHQGVASGTTGFPTNGYIRAAAVSSTVHVVCVVDGDWVTFSDEGDWEVDGTPETGGGGAGGFTETFMATYGVAPIGGVAAPAFTTRNGHSVLAFDAGTQETVDFEGVMPANYDSGEDVTAVVEWCAASATSGDTVWLLSFENMLALDIDADSIATAVSVTSTANGTSGTFSHATFTLDNSELDAVAAGSPIRFRLVRKAADAADTMTGDAQVYSVRISQ